MKHQTLDRLFRKKLRNFSGKPSIEAWDAIERQLSGNRKRKGYIWLSIAASLALAIAAGFYIYFNRPVENAPGPSIAITPDVTPDHSPKDLNGAAVLEEQHESDGLAQAPAVHLPKKPFAGEQTKTFIAANAVIPEPQPSPEPVDPDVSMEEVVATLPSEIEPVQTIAASLPDLPPIVITYSRSAPVEQIAAQQEKTFDRLLALAQDFRASGLADLRRAKDDLLDIDLRKIENIIRTEN